MTGMIYRLSYKRSGRRCQRVRRKHKTKEPDLAVKIVRQPKKIA